MDTNIGLQGVRKVENYPIHDFPDNINTPGVSNIKVSQKRQNTMNKIQICHFQIFFRIFVKIFRKI